MNTGKANNRKRTIKGNMKIKIGFFSVMLFAALLWSHSFFALAALISVFIHEMGHILVAKLLKIGFSECKISIYGAGLTPSTAIYSYKDEIFMCIAGPAVNFLTALLILPFYHKTNNELLLYLVLSSVILGILNILPIKSFDGGRILHSLLCICASQRIADATLSAVSFILIFVLWCVSVYILIITGSGLSSFIFSISLFSKFFINE